jgi:hypothetical protein
MAKTTAKVVRHLATKKVGGVPAVFVGLAIEALRNPAVQQRLLGAPGVAGKQVQAWRAAKAEELVAEKRAAGSNTAEHATGRAHERGLRARVRDRGGRFGQAGLERRSRRLRSAVAALSTPGGTDAVTDAADKVLAALDSIDLQLHVAGALPLAKRTRAHLQIGKALDELENAVWQAVAPA